MGWMGRARFPSPSFIGCACKGQVKVGPPGILSPRPTVLPVSQIRRWITFGRCEASLGSVMGTSTIVPLSLQATGRSLDGASAWMRFVSRGRRCIRSSSVLLDLHGMSIGEIYMDQSWQRLGVSNVNLWMQSLDVRVVIYVLSQAWKR